MVQTDLHSNGWEVHPAASIFPPMTDDEFFALKEDIRSKGQREDVVLWEGKILDGRNRYRACQELGIDVQWRELPECDDPIDYVLSKNLYRRHLTESQRAQCAADLATLRRGSNQHKAKTEDVQICTSTIEQAAEAFGVSRRSVATAKHVADKGDKAVSEAVKAGAIKVSAAAKLVDAVPDKREQRNLIRQGKKAVAEAIRPRHASKPADPPLCCVCQVRDAVDGERCQECIDENRTDVDDDLPQTRPGAATRKGQPQGDGDGAESVAAELVKLGVFNQHGDLRNFTKGKLLKAAALIVKHLGGDTMPAEVRRCAEMLATVLTGIKNLRRH